MTAREQLIQEIEQVSDSLVEEVLDFLLFIKGRQDQKNSTSEVRKASHLSKAFQNAWEEFPSICSVLVICQIETFKEQLLHRGYSRVTNRNHDLSFYNFGRYRFVDCLHLNEFSTLKVDNVGFRSSTQPTPLGEIPQIQSIFIEA